MNIRDLEYLVAVAELKHFGKAAEVCYVSQPALSMQIKKLEENLGVKLLERTNKSVILTDCGSLIAERAREILNQVEELRQIAKSAIDPYCGELRIGIIPTLAPYLLPLIMPTLIAVYPKLKLYLIEGQTAALVEMLKQGKLHASFLASNIVDAGLEQTPLFEEEFELAFPSSHPLKSKKIIHPEDIPDLKLLLLDEGHCLRDQALSFCQQTHMNEVQNFRATSLETLRQMVAAGSGITLMPKLACVASEQISYRAFAKSKPVRIISLYRRAASSKQILLASIAEQIKKLMKSQKSISVL